MKFTQAFTMGAILTGAVSVISIPQQAIAAATLSPAEKTAMEQVVHDYLMKNPEILLEASQALQQKQQLTMQEQAKSAIAQNAPKLFSDAYTLEGNSKGNVTLVEFFDYQCIHCKKMQPVVSELMKKDNGLRVIYKEFPIFGKTSTTASKVALAAAMQGKYKPMQDALLKIDQHLNKKLVLATAKSIGLDMAKLEKDMNSDAVKNALAANRQLAESLHLMGTPAFIVAATPKGEFAASSTPTFIPGATTVVALQDLITKAAGK